MLNPSTNRQNLSPKAKLALVACTLCLLIPLDAMRLRAQDKSSDLSGTIYDASGAAVAGATVTLRDQTGKLVAMTDSDSAGKFSFKALLAGKYEMHATKAGFEAYTLSHISLPSSTHSSEEITLRVGEVTEEMDVVAKKPEHSVATEPLVSRNRIHLGGDVEAARLLTKIKPAYPAEAVAAGIEGTVLLHAVIGMDGNPLSLEVINSADPQLARAAVEAVRQWRYRPTLLNGSPIEVDTTISVNFKLSS